MRMRTPRADREGEPGRWRVLGSLRWRLAALLAACSSLELAAPARSQTPQPSAVAISDVTVCGSLRTRTYAWNWFGSEPEGDYRYQGSVARFGFSQTKRRLDWQVEFEVPFILGAPTTAIAP